MSNRNSRNGRFTAAAQPRSTSTSSRRSQRNRDPTLAPSPIPETQEENLTETLRNDRPEAAASPSEPTTAAVMEQVLNRLNQLENELEIEKRINAELRAIRSLHSNTVKDSDIKSDAVSIKLHPRSSLEQRQRWFGELRKIFNSSPRRFSSDTNRIAFAYFCIDPNHRSQWTNYEDQNYPEGSDRPTWAEFKEWTLTFIRGGRSTKVDIAELYHSAHQRPDQDPITFHNYLMSIESQMTLTEEQRAMGYFAKLIEPLRKELKASYQANLPEDRQDMVTAAIRTWDNKNLGPAYSNRKRGHNHDSSTNDSNKRHKGESNRTNGNPPSRSNTSSSTRLPNNSSRGTLPNRDRRRPDQRTTTANQPDHSHLICHNCHKKGHISPNCPDKKDNPSNTNAIVNEITMEDQRDSGNDSESE